MAKRTIAVADTHAHDTTRLSLLDRIGGASAVRLIVERLMDALTSDPFLAPRFAGADLTRLRHAQTRFFNEAFGGHGTGGADTAVVRVDGEALVRVVVHLHDVLDSLGLPEPLSEQLLLAVAAKVLGDEQQRLSDIDTHPG